MPTVICLSCGLVTRRESPDDVDSPLRKSDPAACPLCRGRLAGLASEGAIRRRLDYLARCGLYPTAGPLLAPKLDPEAAPLYGASGEESSER